MAEIRRRMRVCFQRNGRHIEGNGNQPRTSEILILCFSYIYIYYLLLYGFQYVYLKFDPVFYCLRRHAFDTFQLIHCKINNSRCALMKFATQMRQRQTNKALFSQTIYHYQFKSGNPFQEHLACMFKNNSLIYECHMKVKLIHFIDGIKRITM